MNLVMFFHIAKCYREETRSHLLAKKEFLLKFNSIIKCQIFFSSEK